MNPSSLPDFLDSYPEPSLLGLAFGAAAMLLIGLGITLRGYLRHRVTQQRLDDSQTRMKALMDTAVDGVVIIDAKGHIVEFNASAERIFGWRRAEIVGKNVTELMDYSIRASHDGFLANYLRTGEGKIIGRGRELQGLRKDGATMPIRLAIGHAHLPDQDVFVGFVTDISDRVEMELAMRVSEQQLRSLVRNIPGICFRSLAAEPRSTLFISNAVERFTGYPASDFLGQPPKRLMADHIHPDDRNLVRTAIAQALASDRDFHMQYRLLHRDGSQRWVWSNGSSVRDGSGRVKWIDGVILDITERHEMEGQFRLAKEAAERAAQARSDFLANMSHEIRTPLNAILGFTDVMLNNRPAGDDRRYLETIRGAGDSLLHVLNDVLDSAKLDRGAVDLEMLDFDLRQLVHALRETMGPGAVAKGLALEVNVSEDVPRHVRGDRFRIGQVLTNLLGNAVKFTQTGRVDLDVSNVPDGIMFVVRDTGIGIAADRLQAIFEPFTQADASMSRRFGGTGLGTTISKQLVSLMQGQIWVESEVGAGSRFHVVLPLETSPQAAATGPGAKAAARFRATRRPDDIEVRHCSRRVRSSAGRPRDCVARLRRRRDKASGLARQNARHGKSLPRAPRPGFVWCRRLRQAQRPGPPAGRAAGRILARARDALRRGHHRHLAPAPRNLGGHRPRLGPFGSGRAALAGPE
ncbi:MAG: PAS domain S-box protein [Comamonadaceae bacterium]|nr:MAG: PAS domain S-box protein [Comamonadaceae bacterium]